ncbi:Basal-body rod modification protein FlgD [Ruegeria sp. THAF57]|uniref:flagellar hook capping FlgD N-terminal domain-containing protein n=1 Tax=Ruegeria sp. THAF57 TaxID=2744555 RepID=UPI0015E00769|nr:flagellar hook capping FlgD N-terminal domain-containing protein [Ruegeria sp. THAF57]CAD0186176.1 Basal-body rod modification protein FlgD [Ruegeria sp. THAF57]
MINPTTSTIHTGAQTPASQPQAAGLASDFETFLLMLTAQAKNQDPLEPLDSSEYASQLAQFSMVEQQVQTNALLSGLSVSMGNVGLEQLAGWVGMDVRSASAFQFDGAPVKLFAKPDVAASSASIVVRNASGTVVDRVPASPSNSEFVWTGTDSADNSVPAGTYSAALESYDGEDLLSEQTASAYNRVVEAQAVDDALLLTLESGQIIPVSMVSAVRSGT